MNSRYTFKAKRKDNQEWVYGYYVKLYNSKKDEEIHFIYTGYCERELDELYPDYIEINPSTLCQCTGLQDIEGNYIFENDICNMLDSRGNVIDKLKVIWSGEETSYQIVDLKNNHISFDAKCWLNNCKIIGNKFDEVKE